MLFWLINFFPSIFIHLLLVIGILLILVSSFLGMIPFISQYKIPGQILGFLLFSVGLFYEGSLSYKESMDKEISDLKVQIAKAEAESASKNTQIESLLNKKTTIVHEKGQTIVREIQNNAQQIDNQCVISPDVIDAHNRAATLDLNVTPTKDTNMVLPPRTTP